MSEKISLDSSDVYYENNMLPLCPVYNLLEEH